MTDGIPLLALHTAATLMMVGVIWFVQVVHYPLLLSVGPQEYEAYQRSHVQKTTWVVTGPMILEAVTAVLILVGGFRWAHTWELIAAGAALALIWISTLAVQVPIHDALLSGFHQRTIAKLVATNWVRTAAWSCRGIICLVWGLRAYGI